MTATPFIPSTTGKFQKVIAVLQDSNGTDIGNNTGLSIDIKNNEFTVKTKSWFSDNAMFFWSFTATRKDIDPLRVEY